MRGYFQVHRADVVASMKALDKEEKALR
jgi:hypothetical protein